ncbi:MAG TPA: SRPBCC domain-containing protein [Calditrichia bacterium]|nr:SRPBCC domain-containing protein [Calditrichota bacterium]HQU71383.1 SRPBCC domain-containing protein [Calditrichia bacterium]HQV30865.1 SRPBCC domain-containing protein [Calditrichia bacterium]
MLTFNHSRKISASVEEVFAAISSPERLARWWGPAGFTNTFDLCEFRTGGRWSFVMHGPDGRDYPNENVFEEIEAPGKVVVKHVSQPHYRLTIKLTPDGTGTAVSWTQVFENPDIDREKLERIVGNANEENLDRLTDEVLNNPSGK